MKTAYLTGMSTTRKEVAIVIAMQRDVKHARVVVEGFLGAVAMVNILDNDWMTGQEVAVDHIFVHKSEKRTLLSVF